MTENFLLKLFAVLDVAVCLFIDCEITPLKLEISASKKNVADIVAKYRNA